MKRANLINDHKYKDICVCSKCTEERLQGKHGERNRKNAMLTLVELEYTDLIRKYISTQTYTKIQKFFKNWDKTCSEYVNFVNTI